MSFINLARPQFKNSQDIYARNCDFKTLKVDNTSTLHTLIATTGDIDEIVSNNILTDTIYTSSIEGRNEDTDLSLDLMPATVGSANQVLSRAPNFNPGDPTTFKTVWQTVSGGGGGGNVNNPMTSNLDANNFNITDVNTLEIKSLTTPDASLFINCNSRALTNVNAIQLSSGLYFSSAFVPEENHVLYVAHGGAGPIIDYKKAVFNPVEENINMNDKSITNNNNIETKGISSSTGFIAVNSNLNMFNDINMDSNDIFNVERMTATHSTVSLNLDMIPATEGKANQYLARDPAFSPSNYATHKLVWQTPSSGGSGVQNPMNALLDCNGYGLVNVSSLTSQNSGTFNILLNGNIISNVGNSLSGITNLTGFNATMTLNGEIKIASIFKSNNISPSSGTVLTITAPTIDVNSTTTTLNGDIKIANTFKTNNIAPNTGTTLTVTSPILALNSSSNILITSPSIITTGNITLGTNKKLITTLAYTDFIGSSTNTDLTIGGITEDGKTETKIVMSAPSINLNNNFSTTVPDTQVNINGAVVFNNTSTNPYIQGPNLTIRGRTSTGIDSPVSISASTLNITSSTNNNIIGTTNFDKNINVLSGRTTNINPPIVLYRTYGPVSGPFDITNNLVYTYVTLGQGATSRGTNVIPVGGYVIGDIYKISLCGYMSTATSGNIVFYINFGSSRACSFSFINVGQQNYYYEFTANVWFRDNGFGTFAISEGTGKLERSNFNTLIINPVAEQSVNNLSQAINISIKQSVNTSTGTVYVSNYKIEVV